MVPVGPLGPPASCLAAKHLARGQVLSNPQIPSKANFSVNSAAGQRSRNSVFRVIL